MAGLASLLDAVAFIAEEFHEWGEDGVPLIAKGDHAQAYRQCPVHPDDIPLLVCLVWDDAVGPAGGFRAFAHKALPFGAFGAVWGYSRVGASVVHILRRLFAVAQFAYVDDFFRGTPRRYSAVQQWIFREVHMLLGIPLKEEKNHGPAAVLELLGLQVVSARNWAGLRLTDRRVRDLRQTVERALVGRRVGLPSILC